MTAVFSIVGKQGSLQFGRVFPDFSMLSITAKISVAMENIMSKKSIAFAALTAGFLVALLALFFYQQRNPEILQPKKVLETPQRAPNREIITDNKNPGKKTEPTGHKSLASESPPKATKKAPQEFAVIRGRILAPDGSGMEKSRVYCHPFTKNNEGEIELDNENSQRVKGDRSGEYSLKLRPGQYRITAGTRGPFRGSKDSFIVVKAGDEQSMDLQLRPYLTLKISIKDKQGRAIEGATLWLQPEDLPGSVRGPELITDAAGIVKFMKLYDERHNLLISHPKYAAQAIKIVLKESIFHSERDFVLEKGLTLTGTLVCSQTKKTLADASMTIQKVNDSVFHTRFECDPDGVFTFPSLSPGRYELTGRAENYDNKTTFIDIPKDSKDIQLGHFELNPLINLTIIVIDEAGELVPGVAVRLLEYGACSFSTVKEAAEDGIDSLFFFKVLDRDLSNAKGQVTLREFAPGTHNFVLDKKGTVRNFCDAKIVSARDNKLTLRLSTKTGAIKGQFYDKNGLPQENKQIALLREGYTEIIKGTQTDSEGRYQFAKLAPGRYKVLELGSATKDDLDSNTNWLTVEEDGVLVQNVLE